MSLSRRIPAALSPFQNRVIGACLLGGLLAAGAPAQAEEATGNARWVSDSLTTFVRSGPTDGYRIVGTLTSGQKVELLGTQGNYSQVRGENGSTVWIPSRDLQEVPGQAERLPQLEQKVAALTAELDGINDTWKTRVQGMQETLDTRKKLIDELPGGAQQPGRRARQGPLRPACGAGATGRREQAGADALHGLRRQHRRRRPVRRADPAVAAEGAAQAQRQVVLSLRPRLCVS